MWSATEMLLSCALDSKGEGPLLADFCLSKMAEPGQKWTLAMSLRDLGRFNKHLRVHQVCRLCDLGNGL